MFWRRLPPRPLAERVGASNGGPRTRLDFGELLRLAHKLGLKVLSISCGRSFGSLSSAISNRTLKKYFRKPDGRQREDGVASATQIKSRTPTTLDAWAISQRRSTVSSQTARDLFVVGLRNAHAMEHQSQELMERQSERLTDFPEVHAKVNQHLQETRTQLTRLEECLEHLGESPSVLKDTALSALGNVTASTHAMAGDEILKDIFADDAFEHYEVAAYKSLLVLCERADISVAESPLQASLREEENMATWIDENVKDVTLSYLAKEERNRAAA